MDRGFSLDVLSIIFGHVVHDGRDPESYYPLLFVSKHFNKAAKIHEPKEKPSPDVLLCDTLGWNINGRPTRMRLFIWYHEVLKYRHSTPLKATQTMLKHHAFQLYTFILDTYSGAALTVP